MNEVVLSIGSNVSPRRERVMDALMRMREVLSDSADSGIYETPEIHGIGRPYMNSVMVGRTSLTAEEMKTFTKELELKAGRDAEARKRGDVPVDIDIVVWNNEVIRPNDYRQSFFRIGAEALGVLNVVGYDR